MIEPGLDIAATLLDERSRQRKDGMGLIGHRHRDATDIDTRTQ
jgi:hypothetical protein